MGGYAEKGESIMSKGININGFIKDAGGAGRVTAARREKFANASPVPNPYDPIRNLADNLHPVSMKFVVTEIREASPTSLTFRFTSQDGHLPVFQSGQYVNFRLKIGDSILTRPYTISSAPYEARGKNPFFEVTIRRNMPYLVPDYFFDNVKVGDVLEGAMPFGNLYFEPLRDSSDIVGIAGGVGITLFYSLAKEIAFGKLRDCTLTILYGSVKSDDIVLKSELDKIESVCPNVKVIHILSDDSSWQGEKGFVSREIIEKYSPEGCTYMFCGPYKMYQAIQNAMDEMGVPKRRFRCDVINNPSDVTLLPGYPKGEETKTHKITVVRGIQEDVITAQASESVAVALERSGIVIDTHCRNGECGFCRSQLLSGDIFVSPLNDGRRLMDKEMGWFHPCSSWPLGDLKIKIPIM